MRSWLWDGLAGLGLALVCWGLWMAWPPSAPIAAGVSIITVAILGAKRHGPVD